MITSSEQSSPRADLRTHQARRPGTLLIALALILYSAAEFSAQNAKDVKGSRDHLPDPPPKPDFPDGVIVPTEPVGYLPGAGSVSSAGHAGYTIPLDVPPGRLGIQPELSLSYSSSGSNGILGVGWGITGLRVIARCSHTCASGGKADGIDWDGTDAFCLDGQKLVGGLYDAIDNTLVFRTEQETYAEVRAHLTNGSAAQPSKFVVRTRDGRILTFKPLSAERITVDPLDPGTYKHLSQAVVWPVTEVRDRSGNFMSFGYEVTAQTTAPFSFSYLPKNIRYTFSATAPTTPAEREVRFVYEDRLPLDQPLHYSAGVRTVLTKRLSAIEMYAPVQPGEPRSLAWRYVLDYDYSDSTSRSLLKSVKQCDPLGICKWAKQFTWTSEQDAGDLNQIGIESTLIDSSVQTNLGGPTAFRLPPGGTEVPPDGDPDSGVPAGGLVGVLVGDFDNDGRDDALYWDDYKTEETFNSIPGQWGKLTWYLKLRLSKSSPLSHEYAIGTAYATIAKPFKYGKFVGLNLGASRVIDVDGDGAAELFLARDPFGSIEPEYAVHRWDDDAGEFKALGAWAKHKNVDFSDLNGDGLIDMLESIKDRWHYRLNQGGSFGPAADTGVTDEGENGNNNTNDECRGAPVAGDFDGDGRGDYLVAGPLPCDKQVLISLDDTGQVIATTVAMPKLVPHYWNTFGLKPKPHRLADVNGDGLDDIVSNATVRFNTGRGFLAPVGDTEAPPHTVVPIDLNGDGRADLITRESTSSYVDFSMVGAATKNLFFSMQIDETAFARAGDFDGDGAPDLLALADDLAHPTELNDPQKHKRQLFVRKLDLSTNPDLLTEVKDEGASHAREKFTYSREWNPKPSPQTCAYPQNCIKRGMSVVREHEVSQGERLLPAVQRTLYTYDKPRKDVRGRGFLGFAQVTELLDGLYRQRVTVYDNATRVLGANQEFYPLTTVSVTQLVPILEQPATVPSGEPPTNANARITIYTPTVQTVYPTPSSQLTRLASWTSVERKSPVAIGPDGVVPYGAAALIRERYGRISYYNTPWSNPESTTSVTVGGVTTTHHATYIDNPADWLIGQLDVAQERTWDADDAQPEPRTIDRDYDSAGRLFRVTREPSASDSLWQQTEINYDLLGQPWRSVTRVKTGQAEREEHFLYDVEKIFVERTQNAAGHWHTKLFHPALGVRVLVQDANLVSTTFNYDAFGRFRAATRAGGMKVAASYGAHQPVAGVNAGLEVFLTGDDGSASIERVDELGRTFEDRHRAYDGTWASKDAVFNLFGQATSVSRPGVDVPSPHRAQITYDGLGRSVKSVEPDGATTQIVHTVSAAGLASTSTNADGDVRTFRNDRDGRLVQKEDRLDNQTLVTTKYTYKPFNQIEHVIDHLKNQTTTSYDRIGRKTFLHDPDAGDTSYAYTGFDDLLTETSPIGTQTVSYDNLSRALQIGDSDGNRSLVWDTATNGVGKLASTHSPDKVTVAYSYDGFSRPETEVVTLGSVEQFQTKISYDTKGRPEVVAYPIAPKRKPFGVRNVYNTFGYLQSRVDADDASIIYWTVSSRELDGALKGRKQGNLSSSIVHDEATGRVKQLRALSNTSGTPLLSLNYEYLPDGDILSRGDDVSGRIEFFKYDGLSRLSTWYLSSTKNAFAARDTSYSYDLIGNLTKVSDGVATDTAVYTDPRPHAITSLNGKVFSYDGRGRQFDGPQRSVTFKAFDLPKQVIDKANLKKATYLYDATQNRVRKTDLDGTITTYIGGIYERRESTAGTQHVFMVSGEDGPAVQIVHQAGKDTLYHLSGDLNGSVGLVFNAELKVLERRYAEPFGGRVAEDGKKIALLASPITRGFTGHEEERDVGLINMRGRIYDPAQRRFITPDPFVPRPLFSQSYNRYSYVLNNPLRYTDPNGFREATTNSVFEPPPAEAGGRWKLKSVSHPSGPGGSAETTWEWVPDAPQTAAASDDTGKGHADVDHSQEMGKLAIKHDLAQGGAEAAAGRCQGGDKGYGGAPSYGVEGQGGQRGGPSDPDDVVGYDPDTAMVALAASLGLVAAPAYVAFLAEAGAEALFTKAVPAGAALVAAVTTTEVASTTSVAVAGTGWAAAATEVGTLSVVALGAATLIRTDEGELIGVIVVSHSLFPESAKHIDEAQAAGYRSILTIDRLGYPARRARSLDDAPPAAEDFDRDEYPPALFLENNYAPSVKYIDKSDNRAAGAFIGAQAALYSDQTRVWLVTAP